HLRKALADHFERAEREPYGNAIARRERRDAADVVRMLVRDEDGRERRRFDPEAKQARGRIANAETAIDQDARVADFDDETVAFAAASERGEAHVSARRARSARDAEHRRRASGRPLPPRYLSWSRSSARIRSVAGDLSGLPVGSWTLTVLCGEVSTILIRY